MVQFLYNMVQSHLHLFEPCVRNLLFKRSFSYRKLFFSQRVRKKPSFFSAKAFFIKISLGGLYILLTEQICLGSALRIIRPSTNPAFERTVDMIITAYIWSLFLYSLLLIVTWSSWILDQSTCKEGVEDEGEETQHAIQKPTHLKTSMGVPNPICLPRKTLLRITITMGPLLGLIHLVTNMFCPPGKPVQRALMMVSTSKSWEKYNFCVLFSVYRFFSVFIIIIIPN